MASSTPAQQSSTLPPPLHSPPSPYTKNRTSTFGSAFEEYDDASACRSKRLPTQPPTPQQQQQQQQQVHGREGDRYDADGSGGGRWGQNTSQPSTPCTELPSSPHAKPSVSPAGLATPPSSVAKDARLACRQYLEEAYTPTSASEAGGESERPQKKELRLEDCTSNNFNYRSVFSPAYVLSSATSLSLDTGCTDGRDFSMFSFTSSVRDNLDALGGSMCRRANPLASSNSMAADTTETPLVAHGVPAPSSPTSSTVHVAAGRPTAGAAEGSGAFAARMSKFKRRLQNLSGPAFDLKAVQEAQRSFLEEEAVCNAAQSYPMSDITSLLAVGSWKDASDPVLLKKHNIGYVLNVAKELIPTEEAKAIAEKNDIVSEWIPMSDSHSQDVSEHLLKAFRFIERARKEHSRVLVHCRRGISRSAAIIVAYLMASEHRSYEDALRFVTERRSCVSLNLAFQERLSEFVPSSEFFHGSPLQPPPPQQQQPSAASPPSASSSGVLLPTHSVPASLTDNASSGHASHLRQPRSMPKPENPLLRPRECHSVSSSANSSRASSGVRTAPSQSSGPPLKPRRERKRCLRPLRASKQTSLWCSTVSSSTPTSTTATSLNSASLEEVSAFHSPLQKHQHSRRGSGVPRAFGTLSSTTRMSTPSVATTAMPDRRSAEDEVMGTPAPESLCSRDNGDNEGEEPSSPMGADYRGTLARFSVTQASSSSTSIGSPKNLPRSYSEEEVRPITTATTTVTATLSHLSKHVPDGTTTTANEEAGDGEVQCGSSSANTNESFSHLHCSPRVPAHRGNAFDDFSGGDDDGSGAPESTPTTELPLLQKKRYRKSRLRTLISGDAAATPSPVTESQPYSAVQLHLPVPESGRSGSEEQQDSEASEMSNSHAATVGGDKMSTTATRSGPSATCYGTRNSFNEEEVAPPSPTASQSSPVLADAIPPVPSRSG
ncbi:hypothetical protein LSCM1_07698 [Leishmania martiniquensis]|uniref:protein-tyrosine-phosphatase n=1 Tax=Leishmania martiniquensis TaxID=1580590 RepID=A0A836HZ65_9TRYP|nr:hypothetical protein LSCM1_07698 [Leishmania martiniquensis]